MGTNRSGRAHIERLKRRRRDLKRLAAKAGCAAQAEAKAKPANAK
jgi:hypothetical protein